MTETRPPATSVAQPDTPAAVVPETWLTTSDHKRLGLMYGAAATLFALVGIAVGLVMEICRGQSNSGISQNDYAHLFNLHTTVTVLLFLAPLWVGLATYLV